VWARGRGERPSKSAATQHGYVHSIIVFLAMSQNAKTANGNSIRNVAYEISSEDYPIGNRLGFLPNHSGDTVRPSKFENEPCLMGFGVCAASIAHASDQKGLDVTSCDCDTCFQLIRINLLICHFYVGMAREYDYACDFGVTDWLVSKNPTNLVTIFFLNIPCGLPKIMDDKFGCYPNIERWRVSTISNSIFYWNSKGLSGEINFSTYTCVDIEPRSVTSYKSIPSYACGIFSCLSRIDRCVGRCDSGTELATHQACLPLINVGLLAHEPSLPSKDPCLQQQNYQGGYTNDFGNIIIFGCR
jgi:hypothetical protein